MVGSSGNSAGGTWTGGGEVQLPDMTKKVIPFRQPTPCQAQPEVSSCKRILICIGKQRVALDIYCQATILNSPPAPAPVAVMARASGGDRRHKPKS
jgi:hypothetical protein